MSERGVVEAALFVASGNLTADKLAKICNLEPKRVREIADDLVREYGQRDGGLEVFKAERAYGMRIKPEYEESVTQLIPETQMPKAMLKTLAMIAYEQPVKQSYIVKIRGNRVYEYMKRLQESGFIERKGEGHTMILSTTPKFRQYFRINDAKELIMKKAPEAEEETIAETPEVEAKE
jgi:segregation and condensation protein B